LSSGEDHRLEELLNAAGRAIQPQHPGWATLTERLASLRQERAPGSPWRSIVRVAGLAAAALLIGAFIVYSLIPPAGGPGDVTGGGRLRADDTRVVVERRKIELTLVNPGEGDSERLYMPIVQRLAPEAAASLRSREPSRFRGLALVKDHRLILNLVEGDNVVRFTDVAATLDPTSVRLVSDTDPRGTQVLEQSFEYDVATADTLLRRYLERPIVCIDPQGKEIRGILNAFDADSLLLTAVRMTGDEGHRASGEPLSLQRSELQAIRLNELPEGLVTRPTLVWKLRARVGGKHETTLSYLCGQVQWRTDYVAQLLPGASADGEVLDLDGWVTIENQAGATFHDAGLKLVAGGVHRVTDPWAQREQPSKPAPNEPEEEILRKDYLRLAGGIKTPGMTFNEKSFFEYRLFTLNTASTFKDRQVKQIRLLQAPGVLAKRRYVFDPLIDSDRIAVQLVIKNTEANGLGMALPRGQVSFQQADRDGGQVLLGRDAVDHAPVGEDLVFTIGNAFDLSVEQRVLNTKLINTKEREITIQVRIRSQKSEPVVVKCLGRFWSQANWQITGSTRPWQQRDARTAEFEIEAAPQKETVLQYTVHYGP
jgi:hypothetical protein